VNDWERGGKVTESKTLLRYVVLNDRCIVDLSDRACSKLIVCQRTAGFCELSQPRNTHSLKQFSQCATEIDATILGWISLIFVTTLVDWLHKGHLPRCRLDFMYP